MRWANKIMSNNPDKSQSKLSSRSLSKFKKVNLQKSQLEISSNANQQKSVLKLTSVQKIKPSNYNRSYISNYVNFSQSKGNSNVTSNQGIGDKSSTQFFNLQSQNQNIQTSRSQQVFMTKINDSGNLNKLQETEGFGFFQRDYRKSQSIQQKTKSPGSLISQQKRTPQQKLKFMLQKLRQVFLQFKEVSQNIKKQLDQSTSSAFFKLQNDLTTYVKQFETNIQIGIYQLISLINKEVKTSSFKFQNLVRTNQVQPPSPQNQSFYKIKYFAHEDTQQNQTVKQQSISRPNSFKNKFKQLIDTSTENYVQRNQPEKHFKTQIQPIHQKSPRKLSRKKTNPTPRVNSLLRNDSSVLNDNSVIDRHNESSNSIRYSRINDRSASKSVRKLQQKIVLIKNIFNSSTSNSNATKNDSGNMLIENK